MVKLAENNNEDRRTRILDAADAVFLERGIDGARMQEIADQAGVNKSLLHYYFRSKSDLARAVWQRVALGFIPGVLQMLGSDLALDEKIDRCVDAYHAMLIRHPYIVTYVLSESARRPDLIRDVYTPERRRAARRMIDRLQQQIDAEVASGRMAPVPAEQFFVTLLGSCLFPFAARPMLSEILGFSPKKLQGFMEQRRKELPMFLKRALYS